MASNVAADNLRSLCECPVCFDTFNDPRLLKCGHQFCCKCLSEIQRRQPDNKLPCPTCRETTEPKNGDVFTLPKSTLTKYMQELIFQLPEDENLGKTCTKCGDHEPTRHCPDCKPELAFMCDGCFAKHQKVPRLAKHSTVEFDPLLVCSTHLNKMVECFCEPCQRPVCDECIFEDHGDHKVSELKEMATHSRKLLRKYLSELTAKQLHKSYIPKLNHLESILTDSKRDLANKRGIVKSILKILEGNLDKYFDQMDKSVDSQLTDMKTKKSTLAEVQQSQEKMIVLVQSLLGDVSDPQVIMGARDLPELDTDIKEVTIEVPDMDEVLDKITNDLQQMADNLTIKTKSQSAKIDKRGSLLEWNLQKSNVIKGESLIKSQSYAKGMTFDSEQQEIVARYDTDEDPIMRYSLDGKKIAAFGKQEKSIKTDIFTQLCIDYRRQLYLIPCNDGTFIRMTRDGQVKDTKQIGTILCAVDHLTDEDLYVVSVWNDKKQSQVLLISPDDLSVVSMVTDKVRNPQFLCVGKIEGKSVIVISDWVYNKIYIYTPCGELIRTYESGPLGKLSRPDGVSMDSLGRIYVCDVNNYRILRIYTDKDGDHWECILNKEQLGGNKKPISVVVNDDLRHLGLFTLAHKDVILYNY